MKGIEEILESMKQAEPVCWLNPLMERITPGEDLGGIRFVEMKAAQARWLRFMPYLAKAFPETEAKKGLIESDLVAVSRLEQWMGEQGLAVSGKLYLKKDSQLPVVGSVKARGGIYEVLKLAEVIASREGIMKPNEDHSLLLEDRCKQVFGKYTIHVSSTGNLGLSVGTMGRTLGFQVIVHLSKDAKEWKKKRLRACGARVEEYEGDYSYAVQMGRRAAKDQEYGYFVDDENSLDLFAGYAAVGFRMKMQMMLAHRAVDASHPLFVYLPCGVGGAPGGICYGLKQLFGNHVHCFFVEPVNAPCMMLGMVTGKHNNISVYDIGLSGLTEADGLAVGRPSAFVGKAMEPLLSGAITVKDEQLLACEKELEELEGLLIEPSGCAGLAGFNQLSKSQELQEYIKRQGLEKCMNNATHILWATGGRIE